MKFFVSVKLNSFPVIDAQVKLLVKVTKHHNSEEHQFVTELLDNGNGDPDVRGDDGIYSRYFTDFIAGEGRYDIEIHVTNEKGTARLPASNYTIATKNVKLGSFSRIVKGSSLRIMSLAPAVNFSPARILDLSAFTEIEEERVLLSWTAPGDVLDQGRVMSYKIYASELSTSFYKRNRQILTEIAATQRSGALEKIPLSFDMIKKDSFIAVCAVNKMSKIGKLSNVVHVKLPELALRQATPLHSDKGAHENVYTENISKKSDKVLFYVLFAIIAAVLICIMAVLIIMKRYRNIKTEDDQGLEDPMDDMSIIDIIDATSLMVNQTKTEPILTGFQKNNQSILKKHYDEEELCNCHEVYNNHGDLVINPYINYSSLNSYHRRQEPIQREPIYQNQQEVYAAANNSYPIYSVVNKPNKNVRIQIQNELTDEDDTEAETEHTEEDEDHRCLTPSNVYLEVSFENQTQNQQSPHKILPNPPVYNSTPNGKIRTITQV